MMFSRYHILLTVDVEDWFQVENLRQCCPVSSWSSCELRVERNTHRLLDLLDEASLKRSAQSWKDNIGQDQQDRQDEPSYAKASTGRQEVSSAFHPLSQFHPETEKRSGESCLTSPSPRLRATFFVLGWIAERLPNLVREIHARGHEIASHGYGHEMCTKCSPQGLRKDLVDSKTLLEDIIGERVYGYRAPSFSVDNDILRLIRDSGYLYDSSYNSFSMHGRYGKLSLNGKWRNGIAYRISEGFYELPISNLVLSFGLKNPSNSNSRSNPSNPSNSSPFVLPWGGGAYFRLIPAPVFRLGVREVLRQQDAYLFYMHPWEVDPEQPRPEGTKAFSRFKHYTNLIATEGKLRSLLLEFKDCSFVSCHQHLQPK
jgi:polysaccharide deacetylase family protein (PEP-CTERM system associated)